MKINYQSCLLFCCFEIFSNLNFIILIEFKIALLAVHRTECSSSTNGALSLNNQNFDTTLSSHELVFINFYANWCRFSQMLEPIYDEFATKLAQEPSLVI
jgi:thiol-disulfide isomerase/thioredoxin